MGEAKGLMQPKVSLVTVVKFAGDVAVFAGLDLTPLMTKRVPDGRATSVAVDGSFNLVRSRRCSPDKIGPEGGS